jgi:hypothetical protein
MNPGGWQGLVDQLRGTQYRFGLITRDTPIHRIEFDVGLTDAEVAATEARFGFQFPPDLRAFLQIALPSSPRFPNWRSGEEDSLRHWLDLPRRGILFDIEHNKFWLEELGPRPDSLEEARKVATELFVAAPKLIPIYGNAMIPDEPHLPGNPVFSVDQTDIIYWGFDLADALRRTFRMAGREPWPEKIRPIRFWDLNRFQEMCWRDTIRAFDNSEAKLPFSSTSE